MDALPSGTVSMLFSDIEGSTMLLTRLGPLYVEALDDQRRIMRGAWTAHGGTELGTEGDSFFVVFTTAASAVGAAVQAQRELEQHRWPDGEVLRVRIGIHTGSPRVHEDSYWGMDVHRAARIAGSAHGGQVVVSAVTADLAGAELPDGVELRDLGLHQLKDIPAREHLYQLDVDGLPHDFPALRTLGTSSSLPHPATPLVGREEQVAEMVSLLGSPDTRLVTLSGPGGAGKTRLAIAVAERLVPRFPDGVYFVPLAAVTTADVMQSSVAEALDVPPRERTPARLLACLAPRSALIVLDNLEQVSGADKVVDELLDAAPGVAVVVTSRHPLGLPAEHRHAVPPLSLPDAATPGGPESSGAVQLFAQRAHSVQPRFQITRDNVHDVVAICRRLDGLPLAIELCASRIRVLSPRALLGRLDGVLDMPSTSGLVPARQKTLRDTIAWSTDLLTPDQRALFRRLSVFAGGCDLDAIAAIMPDRYGAGTYVDPVDAVADLVDASLAEVTDGPDGEPRLTMLQTIRTFASELLDAENEVGVTRARHAAHYAGVAERLQQLRESKHMTALGAAETELDNFREALTWAVPRQGAGTGDLATALRLCSALGWVWWMGGYIAEGRHWHERVISATGGTASPKLAACLGGLANLLLAQGEFQRAHDVARDSLAMARSLGDQRTEAFALGLLGTAEQQRGDVTAARATLEETVAVHRRSGDKGMLARTLGNLAGIEESLGDLDRAENLIGESLGILDELGDVHEAVTQRQNLANLLVVAGRAEEAGLLARGLVDPVLELRNPNLTMAFANTCMNILIRLGEAVRAAELFGAEEEMHDRLDIPNPFHDEELEEAIELVADVMPAEEWNRHRRLGRAERVEDLLVRLRFEAFGEHPDAVRADQENASS